MKTWSELFGVAKEAIIGSPDSYRAAEKDLLLYLEELQIVIGALAVDWGPSAGFNGLAADAFGALTVELGRQLRGIPEPVEAVAAALSSHANELDELIFEAVAALRTANERHDRLERLDRKSRQLQLELTADGLLAIDAGVEIGIVDRSRRLARDELEHSLGIYERLRSDEDDLNSRTVASLTANSLPTWPSGFWPATTSGFASALDGPGSSWLVVRQVFLDGGIDVAYPEVPWGEEQARSEGCTWLVDGVMHINVGGPYGGDFAVGADISEGVYAAMLVIMGGNLPDARSWQSVDDLSQEEFSALNWAMATNFAVGEMGQIQMTGTNGAWQNYLEGGDWTPQPIHTMDGLEIASELGEGGDIINLVIDAVEPLRENQLCSD